MVKRKCSIGRNTRKLQSNKKLRAKQLKKYDREKSAFFYDANIDYVSAAHIGEQIVECPKCKAKR